MMNLDRLTVYALISLILPLFTGCVSSTGDDPRISGSTHWRSYADPAAAGWSEDGLEAARSFAEETNAGSVLLTEDGVVVVAWGEIDRPLPLYSMRKGIYNALIGILIDEQEIDLSATLAELGIDDVEGLTDRERHATVEQLLTSRSGIYHVSAYEPSSMKRNRPERGAHSPGEAFYYNNWDFNVVAHLIEKASGQDLTDFFRDRLAEPLGLQDWNEAEIFEFLEPSRSRYPAQIFRLSARDLARIGQLYLQRGRWNGKQILTEEWIERSWTMHTSFDADGPFQEGAGFGYLWWIHPRRNDPASTFDAHDVYLTRGSDGQVLAVIPGLRLVAVHQTDTENDIDGSFQGTVVIIDALMRARSEHAPRSSSISFAEVEPIPFRYAKPAPKRPETVRWADESNVVGLYELAPGISFLVHTLEGRVFALPRGVPLAEVELFPTADGRIVSPAVDVRLQPFRDESGRVIRLEGTVEGRPVRLERID